MKRSQTKVLGLVLVASFSISGCQLLGGILPMLGGLLGGGATLTDGPENSLFMTGNDMGASKIPFQVHTSNDRLENPDGGKLYGHY